MSATSDRTPVEIRLDELQAEVAALRAELARGVVTRRVAVVDAEGVERVVLDSVERTGSVLVRADRPQMHTTGVEVFASENEDEVEAGLCVLVDGDVVSRWTSG